jgi:hypothetical protein
MLVADVIFPVFWAPYLVWFFPLATGLAVLSEIIVFKLRYRSASVFRIAIVAIIANIVSWVVGGVLTGILPTSLTPKIVDIVRDHDSLTSPGQWYGIYIFCSFVGALILSVVIEYGVWRAFRLFIPLDRLFVTCAIANVTSYIILFAVAYVFLR